VYGIYDSSNTYSHSNALDANAIVCNSGYSRTSTQSFTCDCPSDGRPCETINNACVENICDAVNILSNATVAGANCSGGGATTIPTCSFACEPGFFLVGTETIRCDLHGVWDTHPYCEEYQCSLIDIVEEEFVAGANCLGGGASSEPDCTL